MVPHLIYRLLIQQSQVSYNCSQFRKFGHQRKPRLLVCKTFSQPSSLPIHGAQSSKVVLIRLEPIEFPILEVGVRIELRKSGHLKGIPSKKAGGAKSALSVVLGAKGETVTRESQWDASSQYVLPGRLEHGGFGFINALVHDAAFVLSNRLNELACLPEESRIQGTSIIGANLRVIVGQVERTPTIFIDTEGWHVPGKLQ